MSSNLQSASWYRKVAGGRPVTVKRVIAGIAKAVGLFAVSALGADYNSHLFGFSPKVWAVVTFVSTALIMTAAWRETRIALRRHRRRAATQ